MDDRCFDPDDLDALLDLEPGHADLAHAEGCSACRTLLAAYRSYLEDTELPAAARSEAASEALSRFIDARVGGGEAVRDPRSFLTRLAATLRGPALRPGLALVVLMLAATVFWTNREPGTPERGRGVVRESPEETGVAVELLPQQALGAGRMLLGWRPLANASGYRVQLLSAEMRVIREIETGGATEAELALPAAEEPIFWRVLAFRNGDEIARSPLQTLR